VLKFYIINKIIQNEKSKVLWKKEERKQVEEALLGMVTKAHLSLKYQKISFN